MSSFPGVTVPAGMMPGGGSTAVTVPANVPPGAITDYNALFEALLELQWKNISLPYAHLRTRLRQDLAIHKLTDRDGAYVEGTGRAPLEFSARVPLLNGITPARSEKWKGNALYPIAWRQLFAACADKSSGVLQHPELGNVLCKLESMETTWDAHVRSGVWVDITWLETDEQGDVDNATNGFNAPSPLANVAKFGANLDAAQASINPNVYPQPYTPPASFDDLANQVVAVFDIPTLLSKQYQGQIANIVYQAQRVIQSANDAENSSLNWPLILSGYGIISAAYDAAATQLNTGKPIGEYTVQKDSTLAQVAANIPAPVDQILQLNPNYGGLTVIPQGSVVRYYAASLPSAA